MAASFNKFAFTNMLSVFNAFWIFVSSGFLRIFCDLFAKFSWVSPARSQIGGIVANETPDDRNGGETEILSCDSGLKSFSEEESSSDSLSNCNAIANKYEFSAGNSFCGYIEEPINTSFKVQELFLDSTFKREITGFVDQGLEEQGGVEDPFCSDATSDEDFHDICDFREVDDDQGEEGSVCCETSVNEAIVDQKLEEQGRIEEPFCTDATLDEDFRVVDDDRGDKEGSVCSEPFLNEVISDEEMISFDRDRLFEKSDIVESSDEFKISSKNQLVSRDHEDQERITPINDFWHTNGEFISTFDGGYHCQSDDDDDDAESSGSHEDDNSFDDHEKACRDDEEENRGSDEEDEVEFDVLLQHQLSVRKMKKEMKHARVAGLPTILEDSESTRMGDDLKPLRIDQKAGFKERLDEIQRFYKGYLDKMKRLDILSHQTMYALGFVQLKNQDQLTVGKKLSLPSVKSLLANKFRRHEYDPIQKLSRDLHRDLELVYVGQLCLSWEILKWQYANVEELQLFDPMGLRQFSAAAGEFQQFQVLVQRFTEDEPFQESPRVELYVKSRCANYSLLQVPPVKDGSKKVERKEEGEDLVSVARLGDVIEESMHAFWEFLRGDKKEGGNVGFYDLLDSELKSQIRSSLAKKERRLKDLIRSGKCIAKKFQKQQRDFQLTRELVLAQIELWLVSRVVAMSKPTLEQLEWCQKKLGKISLDGRNVSVESSFLLFPC